jgi:hypothetical protein
LSDGADCEGEKKNGAQSSNTHTASKERIRLGLVSCGARSLETQGPFASQDDWDLCPRGA